IAHTEFLPPRSGNPIISSSSRKRRRSGQSRRGGANGLCHRLLRRPLPELPATSYRLSKYPRLLQQPLEADFLHATIKSKYQWQFGACLALKTSSDVSSLPTLTSGFAILPMVCASQMCFS